MDTLTRNENGFIQSSVDLSKNKGILKVFISDDRYLSEDFRYIVDSNFKSLPNAAKAQTNIILELNKKIQNYLDARIETINPVTSAEIKQQELAFFNSMTNIKFSDENSVDKLKNEITLLKKQINKKNEILKSKDQTDMVTENNINTLSKDLIKKDLELKAKDRVIENLITQLNSKLQELEQLVSQQLNTNTNNQTTDFGE